MSNIPNFGNINNASAIANEAISASRGFLDYNHTLAGFAVTANVWTDVPNNGLGPNTNKLFKPAAVSDILDTSTGYLDFTQLTIGSEVYIRNDFTFNPNINNGLLEVRYVLGTGASEYVLDVSALRMDRGSGIEYPNEKGLFYIYMGDSNTRDNPGKLQIRSSAAGTLTNNGSVISIKYRP